MEISGETTTRRTLPAGQRSVLYALRRRGHATAEEIAAQLSITVSGARQHLQALVEDGLVESAEVIPEAARRGRRALSYVVTPAADTLFPKAYGELTNELLGYLGDADPAMLETIFAKRRDARIAGATRRIAKFRSLAGKVAELTRILDEDGYLATSEHVGRGVHRIIEHNCAIWAVAERYGQACSSELDFIRAVLPDAHVERVQHMVAGSRHCAYEICAQGADRS